MQIRAVIFDIDGTLIDTNEAHAASWHEAFTLYGHPMTMERIRPEIGKGGDQLVPALLGEEVEHREGRKLRNAHDKAFIHRAGQHHFRVFPEVEELLYALRRRGLRLALATSSKLKFVRATEKSAGIDLSALTDVMVTADDASASKPAPDLVLAALNKLDLRAQHCLFVGDTPHDVEAAQHAGVACIGLLCGGCSSHQALRDAGALFIWQDPADFLHHLDEALNNSMMSPH